METLELTAKEYKNLFDKPYHTFISTQFIELQSTRFNSIHYLAFKDSKIQIGIVLAETENRLISPVSAPFGGFNITKPSISISTIETVISCLEDYAINRNKNIEITLPPFFYSSDFISKCIFVFEKSKFKVSYVDLNYQIQIDLSQEYSEIIDYNAKRNLKISSNTKYSFTKVTSLSDIERAFEIIKINRETKGYPLRMTLENVLNTIKIIPADFFILEMLGKEIAAAQVFHVANNIVQVIYWGDIPGFNEYKPMNELAYRIYEYYKNQNIKIIDIGPSSESGIANYGLCEYKESIGCSVTLKYKFQFEITSPIK